MIIITYRTFITVVVIVNTHCDSANWVLQGVSDLRLRHDVTAIAARQSASCCAVSEGESEKHGSNKQADVLFVSSYMFIYYMILFTLKTRIAADDAL